MKKRKFSDMTLEEAMPLIDTHQFTAWQMNAAPRLPGEHLQEDLRRLERFDTVSAEAAKLLLIDALLAECVAPHETLKVWKGGLLESAAMRGRAAYLITPSYAYIKTPLLCGANAKGDDFGRGRAQCLAKLIACRERNLADGYEIDQFGFVSNGRT